MHELGILIQVVKVVMKVVEQNCIEKVKHITLEVGEASGFVPHYLKKLFPIAADAYPAFKKTTLYITTVIGKGLSVKEIGY